MSETDVPSVSDFESVASLAIFASIFLDQTNMFFFLHRLKSLYNSALGEFPGIAVTTVINSFFRRRCESQVYLIPISNTTSRNPFDNLVTGMPSGRARCLKTLWVPQVALSRGSSFHIRSLFAFFPFPATLLNWNNK